MTKNAAIAVLAFFSTLLSACTVYRFSLEPRPLERSAARPSVGGTFSFEYQSEYSRRWSTPDFDEPLLLERLEATLREYGEFSRDESGGATHGLHLHVDVYQPFHGTPPPQAWLTGLTFGLIPSTGRSEIYRFHYVIYRNGVLARESRYSLWQRAYAWILLFPWGVFADIQYQDTQLDLFQDSLRAFLADSGDEHAAVAVCPGRARLHEG